MYTVSACTKLSFVVGVIPEGKLSNEKVISPSDESEPIVAPFNPSTPSISSIGSIYGKSTTIGVD